LADSALLENCTTWQLEEEEERDLDEIEKLKEEQKKRKNPNEKVSEKGQSDQNSKEGCE